MAQNAIQSMDGQDEPAADTERGEELIDLVIAAHESREVRQTAEASEMEDRPVIKADGERIVLSAEKEIVLQCGEASITLTRAGKIIIRGAYVSSRSTGVNRIQGGSVEIN